MIERRLAPVSLLIASLLLVACAVGGDEYIAANEALIDELPLFPGATEGGRQPTSYSSQGWGTIDPAPRYDTVVTYFAPAGATADEVLDFYASFAAQVGWTAHIEETLVVMLRQRVPSSGSTDAVTKITSGDPIRELRICGRSSRISVSVENVEHSPGSTIADIFELRVDHSNARPPDGTTC